MSKEKVSNATKIPIGLSFSGLKGAEAFEIINSCNEDGFNKSTLVVELLLVYGEARKKFGDKAIYFLMACAMGLAEGYEFTDEELEVLKRFNNYTGKMPNKK